MPSNLPTNNASQIVTPGTLYVVATPIGNLADAGAEALTDNLHRNLTGAESVDLYTRQHGLEPALDLHFYCFSRNLYFQRALETFARFY